MMKARLAILVVLLGSGAALAVKPEKPGCSDHALLQAENSVRAADRPRSQVDLSERRGECIPGALSFSRTSSGAGLPWIEISSPAPGGTVFGEDGREAFRNAMEHCEVTLHGRRIGYRSSGSGPLLVLIHGIAGTSATRLCTRLRVGPASPPSRAGTGA
jgi:hypothetical protein